MAVFIKKVNIPQKSDLINIDMTGSGTAQTYRIIKKISDDVVEVLGMSDASTKAFDSNSTNTYAGKTLDTYLNSTWYNTLSATAKSAIVDKTFRQDSWYWGTQGNPDYQGKYSGDTAYQVSLDNASFGNEITRHIYAISVQDVIDYLEVTPQMTQADTTLTYDNVWTMFWNSTTTHSGNIWLRSARASSASYAFYVFGGGGRLGIDRASSSYAVRPAFQIDLSKIDYTFADGRQPVELKPVSVLQKSNNALSRVGMSWKQAPSGYSGDIDTYQVSSPSFAETYIKFGTMPNSDTDFNSFVSSGGYTFEGDTTYQNQTKVYVWGSNAKIKINEVEYAGGNDYTTATEVTLTGNYTIYLGYGRLG